MILEQISDTNQRNLIPVTIRVQGTPCTNKQRTKGTQIVSAIYWMILEQISDTNQRAHPVSTHESLWQPPHDAAPSCCTPSQREEGPCAAQWGRPMQDEESRHSYSQLLVMVDATIIIGCYLEHLSHLYNIKSSQVSNTH